MSKTPTIITKRQEQFCQRYVDAGCRNATDAARDCGFSRQYASLILKRPLVIARIKELQQQQMARTEIVLAEEEITRQSLLRDMARIFRDDENTARDRIEAGKVAGKWLGMEDKQDDPFAGKSKGELEFFVAHGYFPDAMDQSQSRPN